MRHISYASVVLGVAALSCGYDRTVPSDPRVSMLQEGVFPAARYTIAYLPTLGGSRNRAAGISNSGLVAGFVNRPGNATRVAAVWRGNALDTLGTLGGPNSIVQWPGISNNGLIAGITETAALDPLHEEWSCAGSALRRRVLRRYHDDARLLPAGVQVAARVRSPSPLLRFSGRCRTRRVSPVSPVPAGIGAESGRRGG